MKYSIEYDTAFELNRHDLEIKPGDIVNISIEGLGAIYQIITNGDDSTSVGLILIDDVNGKVIDQNTLDKE